MPGSPGRPHPAVAATRLAVRKSLTAALDASLRPGDLVLVGCSGGPDSLALAAAVAFEAPKLGLRAGAVTVDHSLQQGSAEQAQNVKAVTCELGLDPVIVITAVLALGGDPPEPPAVGALQDAAFPPRSVAALPHSSVQAASRPDAGNPGPEAAARRVRYAAYDAARQQSGASAILLGHTMDDQAETVLLGLARGSGARSIAGMAAVNGCYLRPLLGLRRDQTVAACAALDLRPWRDPHNENPAFTRTRVRSQILPLMENLIGPGVTQALARTADQLRSDADALDDLAAAAAGELTGDGTLPVARLADLPAAIRTRVLKRAAIAAGAPAGSLTSTHIAEIDALITAWHGQRWLDLPGGVRCLRRYGTLRFVVPEACEVDTARVRSVDSEMEV